MLIHCQYKDQHTSSQHMIAICTPQVAVFTPRTLPEIRAIQAEFRVGVVLCVCVFVCVYVYVCVGCDDSVK